LFVNQKYAGKVDARSLIAPIDAVYSKSSKKPLIIQGYIAVCDDERIARLAEMAGMTRKPEMVLLVKEFGEEHAIST
jgi:hypothetical protein